MLRTLLSFVLAIFTLTSHAQRKLKYMYSADSIARGVELNDEENYEEAIRLFSMVTPGDTNYEWAVYEKCLSLVNNEQYEDAIKLAETGLNFKNHNEGMFYNLLGTSYDYLDQKEKAIEVYSRAIERYPMDHNLYYNRAIVYEGMDKHELMYKDLKKAVEINPYHASSHLSLANLALNEEQYAQALLALGYFLVLEPTSARANENLVRFNNAVSDKVELESKNLKLGNENDFKKINLLITSYVALRDDYKVPADIIFPYVKQLHLSIEQSVKMKKREGFWENFYLPFYDRVVASDYFEPFVYRTLLSSGNDKHQKIFNKHVKDIKDFVAYMAPEIKSIHGLHHQGYLASNDKIKYWFFENSTSVEAIGKVNKDDQPVGPYRFFYTTGILSSEGVYSDKGEKTGKWTYYHPNGQISGINHYTDGKLDGEDIDYYENGLKNVESAFKDDAREGVTYVYNSTGDLNRIMFFKGGQNEDSLVYYHVNEKVDRRLPMKAGLIEGEATYYRADGTLSSTYTWANDKRNGPFESYFSDGRTSSKGTFKNDNFDGAYISYYPNRKVESQGNYVDGTKVGKWEDFYYDGKLREIATYDEKGKANGNQQTFDYNGLKTSNFEYSKGEIVSYQHFDRNGNVLHQEDRKRGRFWYENHTLDGVKNIEGNYEGDHKEGLWKYYSNNGVLTSEEFYNEQGLLEGEYKSYYLNGKPKRITSYKDDELSGYDVRYHDNGNMSEQGYNWKGKAFGTWEEYYEDGTLEARHFYVNGKYNGPQYFHDPEGDLILIEHYDMGVLTRTESCGKDSIPYKTHTIDLPLGTDVRYYPNGNKVYELNTAGAKFHGPATWWYGTGTKSTEGQYLAGDRHGEWKWYYPGGNPQTVGSYAYGTKTGKWISYFERGNVKSVANYENGELHGEHLTYYENGKMDTKTNYFQGEINGKRYFYDYTEKVDHIRYYDQGRIVGYAYLGKDGNEVKMIPITNETAQVISYFTNGKVSRKYQLKNGMFYGDYLEYNTDGSLRYHSVYVDDNINGITKSYYENGKIKSETTYVNGLLNGESIEYFPNGEVKNRKNYRNGSQHGITEEYDANGKMMNKYEYKGGLLYQKI